MDWYGYHAQQRLAEIGDRFVSYLDSGSGQPVVLLHGIPTWGYLWHRQIPILAEQQRVIVPDLIGFGFSDRRDCFDRSIRVQAEIVDALLNQLGLHEATIIAHDIGGGVALRLATLFPQRVSSLVLLNAVAYDSWPIEMMLQIGHPESYRKLSASALQKMLQQGLKQGFATSPGSELLAGVLAPYRTEVGKLSLIRNAAALNTNLTTELTSMLSRITQPTQILWGEEDKFQLVKYAERLARDIPHAQLHRIEHARHFVMLDQPDQVTDHLMQFLGHGAPVAG